MEKSIFKSQHPMHFHASEKGKKLKSRVNETVKCTLDYMHK